MLENHTVDTCKLLSILMILDVEITIFSMNTLIYKATEIALGLFVFIYGGVAIN